MKTAEKLLDAAELRMRRGGYNSVSFRDLASDVNIKSASVHYHFPTKEAMTISLVERYSARIFEQLDLRSNKAERPEDRLAAFSAVYEAALKHDGAVCLCVMLGSELPGLPQDLQAVVKKFFEANIEWVAKALPSGLSTAEKRRRASTYVAAHQGAMLMAVAVEDYRVLGGLGKTLVPSMLR
ncbi:MAG: TetR/AcrR family transcriptional regulator [Pseudomonadota bacterium]